jgi:LPXTG-site transpeptidase (sortase) family protein
MNIFSNKFINLLAIIISIIIILIINFGINNFQKINSENNSENNFENNLEEKIIAEENNEENKSESEEKNNLEENYNWYLEIPSINLKAPIEEGIEMDVLNVAIGHFDETALTLGNIGLAGHNRGYEKNYFENLKNVKQGDSIIYKYNEFNKEYIVDKIKIIKNTDWSYLENTEENKITLITCTENEPNYRLCVQATEK